MRDAPDMAALRDLAAALEKVLADFRLAFEMRAQKDAWSAVRDHAPLVDALHTLETALTELNAGLKLAAPRGKGLENAQKRAEAALALFARFSQAENAEEVLWYELMVVDLRCTQRPWMRRQDWRAPCMAVRAP